MAEYPLNKEGVDLSRIDSPAYNFKPCDDFVTGWVRSQGIYKQP